jgi:hypothetical protein
MNRQAPQHTPYPHPPLEVYTFLVGILPLRTTFQGRFDVLVLRTAFMQIHHLLHQVALP